MPVELADMHQVGSRDLGKARHVGAARKQPAIHVWEHIGPTRQVGGGPVGNRRVHGPEQLADHLMGVEAVPIRHLVDGRGEQV